MPLYEYQCNACGHRFEVIRKFSEPPLEQCPKCGGAVQKLQSAPAFQFKGTGWYITDYAKKDQGSATKSEESSKETAGPEKTDKKDAAGDKGDKKASAGDKKASAGDKKASAGEKKEAAAKTEKPSEKGSSSST